eukprot:3909460-Karenia_brevis.AAC.1
MGGAAQGEFESQLGTAQMRLEPAAKRLDKAKILATRVGDFIAGAAHQTRLHEAWCITRFCIKEALSYDIRVIPKPLLDPILAEHSRIMRQACEEIAGVKLTREAWSRMQLPGPLSGMGVVLPSTSADAAFVATWQATASKVEYICAQLGRPTTRRVDEDEYKAALERLKRNGIMVANT